MHRRIRITEGTSSHILEESMLVFSESAQTLFELNESGAYMWSCMEQGLTTDEIAGRLSEAFAISPAVARRDVHETIAQWTSLGLLHAESPSREASQDAPVVTDEASMTREGSDLASMAQYDAQIAVRLSGCNILIRCSQLEQAASIRPIFSHLEHETAHHDAVISVIGEDGSHVVIHDGLVVGRCTRMDEIGPLVSQEVIHVAYRSTDYLIAVHAAVVGGRAHCAALPGTSTVGKTTLAAGLLRAGYRYFSDEVTIVDRSSRLVIPCPVSLRVKDGSWEAVSQGWPEPPVVTSTLSPEGFRIRYLTPPQGSFAAYIEEGLPIKSLVFPFYVPTAVAALEPMKRTDAIRMIQEAGYDVQDSLDTGRVVELVDWIKEVDCYRMHVSSLSEGVSLIGGLLD